MNEPREMIKELIEKYDLMIAKLEGQLYRQNNPTKALMSMGRTLTKETTIREASDNIHSVEIISKFKSLFEK